MLSLSDDAAGFRSDPSVWSDSLEIKSLSCGYRDERTNLAGRLCLAMTTSGLPALLHARSSFLAAKETHTFEAMKVDRRRTSFLRGRAAAKRALCSEFGGRPTRWDIRSGVFSQPVTAYLGGEKPPVHVSISHNNIAGVAVSSPAEWPVAIDLETVSEQHRSALESQLTEKELGRCETGPCPLSAITALWTLKEAASKILGGGLALDFKALETVPQLASGSARCSFVNAGHLAGEAVIIDGMVLAFVMSAQSSLTDAAFLKRALGTLQSMLVSSNTAGKEQL